MNFNIYNRNCSIRKSKLIVIYLRNERQEHAHLMNVQVKIISEIPFFIFHATAVYFYILNILFLFYIFFVAVKPYIGNISNNFVSPFCCDAN